ncbi:hypothetical protein BT96DRAFT_922810 [Gymnopus androsaceus JB14]|uniref:Uncharacterized protein n=1 Tax=Gymnopus androsaceus JB14 TaxID=1447944 RepID=A0A6A4HC99_9AGAR|nr:hypothetical protein BT96DRAFT_922810 [Gymnopus androsaceus JB14]
MSFEEYIASIQIKMYNKESIRQTPISLTSFPSHSYEDPENEPNVLETLEKRAMFSV